MASLVLEICDAYQHYIVSLSLGWRREDYDTGRARWRDVPLGELQDLAFLEDAERDVEALLQ